MPKESSKKTYDRLNSVRQRLDALSTFQPKPTQAPTPTHQEPQEPELDSTLSQTLQASAYDPAPSDPKKSHAPGDRAFRQMSHYFDYATYANQCANGKPKPKVKLTSKQVESLKKEKQKKKMDKMKEWLYND